MPILGNFEHLITKLAERDASFVLYSILSGKQGHSSPYTHCSCAAEEGEVGSAEVLFTFEFKRKQLLSSSAIMDTKEHAHTCHNEIRLCINSCGTALLPHYHHTTTPHKQQPCSTSTAKPSLYTTLLCSCHNTGR